MKSKIVAVVLVACLALAFAASPAFAEEGKIGETDFGTFSGQIRYYYFTQRDKFENTSSDVVKESLAIGGFLKYESLWLNEMFQAGVAGYTSQPFPSDFNDEDEGGTQLLTSKNRGITALGEAYLNMKYEDSMTTLYRQRIETPMVNGNDSRMIPQTYEAYSMTCTAVDNLKMQVAWIDKIKLRDTELFTYMSEVSNNAALENSKRGMFMLGGDWSPDFAKTRGWVYVIPNYMQMIFLQAGSSYPVDEDLTWHWLAQGLDQRDSGQSDGGSFNVGEFGALGGVTVSGVKMEVGGTIVDNTTDVNNRWGTYPFFNNMMAFANNRAGEKALFLGLSYDFDRIGWNGFTSSIKTSFSDTPDNGRNASPDRNEYNLNLNYAFQGKLKGLSILNRWSYQESKGEKDGKQVRLRFQYDF